LHFFVGFLQIKRIIVNINNMNSTTASTIIAASAPNIVAEIAAPINNPNTKKNNILNITATIAKQLNFLHFLFVS
jgi:hypothetical protein